MYKKVVIVREALCALCHECVLSASLKLGSKASLFDKTSRICTHENLTTVRQGNGKKGPKRARFSGSSLQVGASNLFSSSVMLITRIIQVEYVQ